MTPRTRFILRHPIRAHRHLKACRAPWPPEVHHAPLAVEVAR